MKSDMPFIVKWSEGSGDQRSSWWVKTVPPVGIVGEYTRFSPPTQRTVEGEILEADIVTVQQLIGDMGRGCSQPSAMSNGECLGLLALGTLARPSVIFRYCKGAEANDECARLFLRIVGILRKYAELTADSAKSA